MAVDDAYAKIEKEEQDAYEKRMAALKQKKEKAKEKERNLIRRGNELKGKKSNLLKKLHKANTSIDASNIDRIEEEEAVIAQTRIDLMVQHESRVEDIKKKCGYNYDEEHKRLQKLEDDIRSNDAERKQLEHNVELQGRLVVVSAHQRIRNKAGGNNQIAFPTAVKSHKDAEPSEHDFEHHLDEAENSDSLALDSLLPGIAIDSRDFKDPLPLSDKFPTVVKVQDEYRELRCHICGANAKNDGQFFMGFYGLSVHVLTHGDRTHNKLSKREKLEIYCSERGFDEIDVKMMLEGKLPASGKVDLLRPMDILKTNATLSKTQTPPMREPANPKARLHAAKGTGRLDTKGTAAVTHAQEVPPAESSTQENMTQNTPRAGTHPAEPASRLPKPSPRVASPPSSSADELREYADGSPALRGPGPQGHGRIHTTGRGGGTGMTTRQASSLAVGGQGLFSDDFKVHNNAPRRALLRKASGLPKKERH